MAITSPSGKKISALLKEYLLKFPDGPRMRDVKQKLFDYYMASGLYITANRLYTELDLSARNNFEMEYSLGIGKLLAGEYGESRKYFESALKSDNRDISRWALVGIADCDLKLNFHDNAIDIYKSIIEDHPGSEQVPFAILGLIEAYAGSSRASKAAIYYDIYKNNYNKTFGYSHYDTLLSKYEVRNAPETLRTSLESGHYIQVGVFAQKKNARSCYRLFRDQGLRTIIDEFKEGKKTYFRVLIGPYKTMAAGLEKKVELEKKQEEDYLILVK
jgi:tetratricopeptide (TPR) repeat protein